MTTPCPQPQAVADLFTWSSLIRPAVVAAAIAAIVSVLLSERRLKVESRLAERRFNFEREQAEQKFKYDVGVTEAKIRADVTLAEKKFEFDRAAVAWRRRYELAEQVLSAAYEARDALNWARVRVIFSGEGETRQADIDESEELKRRRNSYFVPLERLARSAKSFATLETLRYAMSTHFGQDAVKPIREFSQVHNEITAAAGHLIELASWGDGPTARESLQPFRDTLWGQRPDSIDRRIDAAIVEIKNLCRPTLSEKPPT